MKILIVGEGDTGCHLAQMLSSEDQDIILMGRDSAKLAEIDSVYNLFTSVGEAVSPSDLLRNGVDSCERENWERKPLWRESTPGSI